MTDPKTPIGLAALKIEGESTNFDDGVPPHEWTPEELAEPSAPMTVAELIAILAKLPADLRVFVRGYEGGLSNPIIGEVEKIDLNTDVGSSICGWHSRHGEGWEDPSATIDGIVIDRP